MHGPRVVQSAPRPERGEDLAPFPPDTMWTWVASRQLDHLVLPIAGRRSIFVAWPPGSFCEICSVIGPAGYAGPVSGDRAHFPSSTVHQVCEPCARRSLDLGPIELTGHCCVEACTDRLHLEVVSTEALGVVTGPSRTGASSTESNIAMVTDRTSTASGSSLHGSSPAADAGSDEAASLVETLTARGWRIAEITAFPRRWSHGTQQRAALWIEPIRALPWPTQHDDPWVW